MIAANWHSIARLNPEMDLLSPSKPHQAEDEWLEWVDPEPGVVLRLSNTSLDLSLDEAQDATPYTWMIALICTHPPLPDAAAPPLFFRL